MVRHLGLVGTVSTIQYPPYLAARQAVTLDHLTNGRSGFREDMDQRLTSSRSEFRRTAGTGCC